MNYVKGQYSRILSFYIIHISRPKFWNRLKLCDKCFNEVEGKRMKVLNLVILIQFKGKIFAHGQNSEFRPFTKSKPNGQNFVNGQDFVSSVQILLIPTYRRQNSVKGQNSRLLSFCKFLAFSLKLWKGRNYASNAFIL